MPLQLGEFDVIHSHVYNKSVNSCSFVMIHGSELRLIIGDPHGVNPSLMKLLGMYLHVGRIYALLVVKYSMHMLGILGPKVFCTKRALS